MKLLHFAHLMLAIAGAVPFDGDSNPLVSNSTTATVPKDITNIYTTEVAGLSRRGIAYNNVDYVPLFKHKNGHTTWCYNWDSRPYRSTHVEFVPMLHSVRDDHIRPWRENALAAINGNQKVPTHLLGFNEPDNCIEGAGGSCMDVDTAVSGWKTHIQPLKTAKMTIYLGSPAVTNSLDTPSTGLGWLRSFIAKCDGCTIDFITIHWYDSSTNVPYFKQHMHAAREVAQGRPIWITEFKPKGTSQQIKAFLDEVVPWLDASDDIHRYAYFMTAAGDGFLLNNEGSGLSDLGQAYQFDWGRSVA